MPLPPYITRQLEDQSQYQTVYAKELGSAAAPTAGLHLPRNCWIPSVPRGSTLWK